MNDLYIEVVKTGNAIELKLRGKLNLYTVEKFEEEFINEAKKKPGSLGINCESLEFLDKAGIESFVNLTLRCREQTNIIFYRFLKAIHFSHHFLESRFTFHWLEYFICFWNLFHT